MDVVVNYILNGATEFTPEVIIRLMLFMMIFEGIFSIMRIIGGFKA